MKKILSILTLTAFMLTGVLNISAYAENMSVTVFVTVTDITNVDEPINTLVPRRELVVEYMNLEQEYNGTFAKMKNAQGITYMHALIALHKELYGEDYVVNNLVLAPNGETHIFMGKSIDSIMYKNGEDIFTLPQNVPLHEGDEVNICLYNAGHPQKVATFDSSVIKEISPGEEVELFLYEHYESPLSKNPIGDAHITNENGIYIFDENGNIITTTSDGRFSVSFEDEGLYQVSIMPQIEYFYDENGGTTITEYIPKEVVKSGIVPQGKILTAEYAAKIEPFVSFCINEGYIDRNSKSLTLFCWCDDPDCENNYTYEYTEIELEKVETFIPGMVMQQIAYTPPYCIIEVTKALIFRDVYVGRGEVCDNIYVTLKNSEYNSGQVICAAYNEDVFVGMQTSKLNDNIVFSFEKGATEYKVMIWDSISGMKPLFDAKTVR